MLLRTLLPAATYEKRLKKKHKERGSKSERRKAKRQNPNDNNLGSIQKQKRTPKQNKTNKQKLKSISKSQ
jgi:hypothetical protein